MWALHFFGLRLLRVRGQSMAPTIKDKSYVLLRCYGVTRRPQQGDICVFKSTCGQTMVKRLMRQTGNGVFAVRGDGALSAPEIDLGPVAEKNMIGRVIMAFGPERAGVHLFKQARTSAE